MPSNLMGALRELGPLQRGDLGMAELLRSVAPAQLPAPLWPAAPTYTRTCLYCDDRFEVLVLDWAPGAVTEIHDHGGQRCWLMVLQGSFRVDDFARVDDGAVEGVALLKAGATQTLAPFDLDVRSGRFDIHRVAAGEARARTLHVYAGPLRNYSVYDLRLQRCRPATSRYDRVLRFAESHRVAQ